MPTATPNNVKKEKIDVRERVVELFRERGRCKVREMVEQIYGGYTQSGKAAVLRAIGSLMTKEGEERYGLKVFKIGRGEYACYDPRELEKKIGSALLEFNKEGYYVVTIDVLRDKAGIEDHVPGGAIEETYMKVRERYAISRPSLGGITKKM
ncbi:MAG: hypothetical protein QXW58_05120 [Thermosphaera sp.]